MGEKKKKKSCQPLPPTKKEKGKRKGQFRSICIDFGQKNKYYSHSYTKALVNTEFSYGRSSAFAREEGKVEYNNMECLHRSNEEGELHNVTNVNGQSFTASCKNWVNDDDWPFG